MSRSTTMAEVLLAALILTVPSVATADALMQQAKLIADDGVASDFLGYAASINGPHALLGAYGTDVNGSTSGSAYIFQQAGTSWTQAAKLTPNDGAAFDWFGSAVALNGSQAVIGAYRDDDKGTDSGSAYVFQGAGSSWSQTAKLTTLDGAAYDSFGGAVAVNGGTVVIGAYRDDDKGAASGSIYFFQNTGSGWDQAAKLTVLGGRSYDWFGYSVSISGDYAVAGAPYQDPLGNVALDAGAAYVFNRVGSSWTQAGKLVASDAAAADLFGTAVAIDGDFAIVGANWDDDLGDASGSAYVFQRVGSSWSQVAKLIADDGHSGDQFGYAVSISGDLALVGAYGADEDGSSAGAAYVFQHVGSSWLQVAKLTADDAAAADQFGFALSLDGYNALIGAWGNDQMGSSAGAGYVFLVPEPATLGLLALGGLGAVLARVARRRRRS